MYSLKPIVYLVAAAVAVVLIMFLSRVNIDSGIQFPVKAQRESYRLGTIVRITLYGYDREKLDKALTQAMDEIERLENLFSVNIALSDVSLVNRASGDYPVKVSEETGFLIEKALAWSEQT
ncbi:MAG: FAD:protein FMN transferase, partial [Synergistaceae bacterium]|nr:FAD:protein FMN transferase [Synergistaceae bacterium]